MASNVLLDTHVFLWWRTNDRSLSRAAHDAIAEAEAAFVSVASAWEIAIKQGLGKLVFNEDIESGVRDSGFEKLPIAFTHAQAVSGLPAHHNDPFDRMLIAQARTENLALVTRDRRFADYDVPLIWA